MNRKKVYFLIALAALVVVAVIWQVMANQKPADPVKDSLAQCLTDKGAVMYGAEWCPHCQNQKKDFGKSFRLIKYVECPKNIDLCLSKDIQAYPTWIINDKKYEGELSLKKLEDLSGCRK